MSESRTIGVFDSGVGGLSVLRHIRVALPDARLIYVADSAHVPYGDKSSEYIAARAFTLSRFLIEHGAEAIVIACNTATAAAASILRSRFDLPIVAMEPAVKPAVAATRSGVVGVLATVGTLESARFAALLEKYAGDIEIVTQGCPGLVEQVERGNLSGAETRALVERYVSPLLAQGADTLILGCTHYPFLAPLIRAVAGADIALVDTGAAVARELRRRVESDLPVHPSAAPARSTPMADNPHPVCGWSELTPPVSVPPLRDDPSAGSGRTEAFFTSGDVLQASRIISVLWGEAAAVQCLPRNVATGSTA